MRSVLCLNLYLGPRNQTQVARLLWQVCLPAEQTYRLRIAVHPVIIALLKLREEAQMSNARAVELAKPTP